MPNTEKNKHSKARKKETNLVKSCQDISVSEIDNSFAQFHLGTKG